MQSIRHLSFLHTFVRLFTRNIQTAVSPHTLKNGHMFIWTNLLGIILKYWLFLLKHPVYIYQSAKDWKINHSAGNYSRDAYAELKNSTISLVMADRLPGWNSCAPNGRIFLNGIWYLRIFRKSVEKISVSLKSDKNNGHIPRRPMYIYDNISFDFSYNEKCFR